MFSLCKNSPAARSTRGSLASCHELASQHACRTENRRTDPCVSPGAATWSSAHPAWQPQTTQREWTESRLCLLRDSDREDTIRSVIGGGCGESREKAGLTASSLAQLFSALCRQFESPAAATMQAKQEPAKSLFRRPSSMDSRALLLRPSHPASNLLRESTEQLQETLAQYLHEMKPDGSCSASPGYRPCVSRNLPATGKQAPRTMNNKHRHRAFMQGQCAAAHEHQQYEGRNMQNKGDI